jgi:hypothetical protein
VTRPAHAAAPARAEGDTRKRGRAGAAAAAIATTARAGGNTGDGQRRCLRAQRQWQQWLGISPYRISNVVPHCTQNRHKRPNNVQIPSKIRLQIPSKYRQKNFQKTSIMGKIVEFLYQIMQFACNCLGLYCQQRVRKALKKALLLNHHLLLNQSSFTGDNYLDPTWNIWIHHGKFLMCALGSS